MSAPSADYPALSASTSSSGYADGLGRRALAFDREDGTMLERLVVRAELSAFERSLRERIERVAAIDDERLARPRSIERGTDGALVVFSEFVPGSRLSDVLETTAQQGTVPGVEVALGYLLDVLPALCGLHAGAGFAHGAISPGRTVLTPGGQVVLLDGVFGEAIARLRYGRRRLWREFGIAMPAAAGPPRFDAASDIAQAVLSSVMLVLGRSIGADEYPDAIPSLLVEVVDVAQISGSGEFAAALQRFLQRSLPLPGRRPYVAVDDALIDVRDLVRSIGLDVCRRALVEFIEQVDSGGHVSSIADAPLFEDSFDAETLFSDNGDDDESPLEMDLDLDAASPDDEGQIYDLNASEKEEFSEPLAAEPPREEPILESWSEPDATVAERSYVRTPVLDETIETTFPTDSPLEESPVEESRVEDPIVDDDSTAFPELDAETTEGTGSRRKRSRSARSRKDKLSSTARPQPAPPPPEPAAPAPVPKPAHGAWLVEPGRAAAFEPPVPEYTGPPDPPPVFAAVPPAPSVPQVVAPPPPPQDVAPPPVPRQIVPSPGPPIAHVPFPPITVPVAAVPAPAIQTLKLKADSPTAYAPPRKSRPDAIEDLYSPRILEPAPVQESSGFPMKLAGAAMILMVVGVVAGRACLSNRSAPPPTAAESESAPAAAAPAPMIAPKTGRIQIQTQPPGARVLLDGKHVGESPLNLEAPPGRHTLTLASASGSVRRTVRVETGKTLSLDIPIFSGWVDIVAPFILDVSENGQSIGTTEQSRVMLRPGRHELTLSNRELDYTLTQTVEIEPGDVKTLTLNPLGTVNLNATPWAEVWIDGKKIGETPLANLPVTLGTREIVFKHPQFGERRVTATVRASAPVAVTIDMSKQ